MRPLALFSVVSANSAKMVAPWGVVTDTNPPSDGWDADPADAVFSTIVKSAKPTRPQHDRSIRRNARMSSSDMDES
jgi:hypothetical protein